MNSSRFMKLLTVVSLAAVMGGCAAGPKVAEYPRREIDRPFTLPDGMQSFGFGVSPLPALAWAWLPASFLYEVALSDRTTFSLAPAGIRYSFSESKEGYFGFRGGIDSLGFGYSTSGPTTYFIAGAQAGVEKLWRFTDLSVRLGSYLQYRLQAGTYPWSVLGASASGLVGYQLSETVFAEAGPSITWGPEQLVSFSFYTGTSTTAVRLPLRLRTVWAVSQRTSLDLKYAYYGLLAAPTELHSLTAGCTIFW